ncbi:MAG: hypothetical protein P4L41_12315 [Flavipsychrobacter sp.]|nr:hypothetical protein [Flavipsychrobacter sp.]
MDPQNSILDDRRIKLLNFLLQKNKIPRDGEFNIRELINNIPPDEYKKLFEENPEFEQMWNSVDMASSLSQFLVENGIARKEGDNLQLTVTRGRDLQKQGNYNKLLEDERYITSEARRVSELELEADRTAHRQFKINLVIAFGTAIAALYYILEILDGFFGFYKYHH